MTSIAGSPLASRAATAAFLASVLALACLAALHVLSLEFDPAWRMVSEHALGGHAIALSGMLWRGPQVRLRLRWRCGRTCKDGWVSRA